MNIHSFNVPLSTDLLNYPLWSTSIPTGESFPSA